ncbi:MAG: aminopeptidase P family protein [Spirosomataceae bacterium]
MTKYTPLPAEFFRENREKLRKSLPPSSLVICFSNDLMPINADAFYPFTQQSDLYYLTGIDQEDTVFMYYLDGNREVSESLFIRKTDAWIATWEGQKLTSNEASVLSGIADEKIVSTGDWKESIRTYLPRIQKIYVNVKEIPFSSHPKTTAELFAKELISIFAGEIVPLSVLTKPLRTCKSKPEIRTIEKAIEITHQSFEFACKQVKKSTFEYEIEAALTYKMLQLGADGHAFQPIIASGGAANVLHYVTNHQRIEANSLILMDFGASYANYKADITRCIPANGRFTKRQKEVYSSVLTIMRQCIAELNIGISIQDWKLFAEEKVAEQLVYLGLLSANDFKDEVKKREKVKKYFPHSIGHHLGLDVHDTCDYSMDLQAGMLLTCEPGIYIREEGIGIRLETDVLLTTDGPVDLASRIPIEINDIEKLLE